MYYNAEGVPKDHAEALKWYLKSAEQGHDIAQYSLGVMYSAGNGVPKDDEEAYAWCNLAAITNADARELRVQLEKLLTSEQKARAQQRSAGLHKKLEARKNTAGQ